MSLCRKTKINAPLTYEVLNKDVTKSEILPHSPAAKHGYPQKRWPGGSFSIHSLQVENTFPAAHNEEKVKRTSLCLLCSYVKKDVSRSQYEVLNDYPVHLSTRLLVNLPTCQLVKIRQLFSKNFNTMSTLFTHQPPTSSQKIDSREGLF